MQAHEKEAARAEAEHQAKAQMSPNELRGKVDIPDHTDDEDETETAAQSTGPSWGQKARRRQRETIKKLLEVEEERLQENQDELEDKDIEEYLVRE